MAGLFEVDFNQGPLGHVSDKPTTIGTNLPDLQGLKGDPKGPWSGDSKLLAEWAPGFVQAIARALQTWPRYRLVRVTPSSTSPTIISHSVGIVLFVSTVPGQGVDTWVLFARMSTVCPPTLLDLSVWRVRTQRVAITGPQHSSIS